MLLGAFLTLSACSDPGGATTTATATATATTTAPGTTDGPHVTTDGPHVTTDGPLGTTGGPTTGDTNPTGDVECIDAADCPGVDDACWTRDCVDGKCNQQFVGPGVLGFPGAPNVPLGDFSEGKVAWGMAAAELNGDGKTDLVTLRNAGKTVGVALGTGHGTFAPRVDYSIPLSPEAVATGDLDGDGDTDLAVTMYDNGAAEIGVLLNDGDGTFAPVVDGLSTLNFGSSIMALDVNGDAALDLVGFNDTPAFTVHLNNGDGSFADGVSNNKSGSYGRYTAADIDGDDRPDLVTLSAAGVVVMHNNGDGTFAGPGLPYPAPSGSYLMAVADVNGDDKLDFVLTGGSKLGSFVAVLLGSGGGSFAEAVEYPANPDAYALELGDLNGDGSLDLMIAHNDHNLGLTVMLNAGDGSFSAAAPYVTGGMAVAVEVADFNGDGDLDAATLNVQLRTVNVLLGRGDGTFLADDDHPTGGGASALVAADLNGDGNVDFATRSISVDDLVVSVFLADGGGAFVRTDFPTPGGDGYSLFETADFDGDGDRDLVITLETESALNVVRVLFNNGAGTFTPGIDHPLPWGPRGLAVADLNGDGAVDLALVSRAKLGVPTVVGVLRNDGGGGFLPAVEYPAVDNAYAIMAVDLSGDGWSDLATLNFDERTVSVFLNDGQGSFAPKFDYPASPDGYFPWSFAAADLNSDGISDVVVASYGFIDGTNVSTFLNDGVGNLITRVDYPGLDSGSAIQDITTVDLNGDGRLDVAALKGQSVSVLFNQGDGTLVGQVDYPTMEFTQAVVGADLNGDGRSDLLTVGPGIDVATWSVRVKLNTCLP